MLPGNELVVAPYIQSSDDMLANPESVYTECNALMDSILTYLFR